MKKDKYKFITYVFPLTCLIATSSTLSMFPRRKFEQIDRQTALHRAASSIFFSINKTRNALERSDVDIQNQRGQTALHVVHKGNVAQLLLTEGANQDAPDHNNNTPLHAAAQYDRLSVAKQLLRAGSSIEARNHEQCTPLHLAARHGHERIILLLCTAHANVNAIMNTGQTPLHLATQFGHDKAAITLIANGARVGTPVQISQTPHDVIDQRKMTPLAYAVNKKQFNLAIELVRAGACTSVISDRNMLKELHNRFIAMGGNPETAAILFEIVDK